MAGGLQHSCQTSMLKDEEEGGGGGGEEAEEVTHAASGKKTEHGRAPVWLHCELPSSCSKLGGGNTECWIAGRTCIMFIDTM